MRLHCFYIPETIGTKSELKVNSAALVKQIRTVFRLKSGDSVVLFDGSGSDYVCRIEDFIGHDSILFAVTEAARSRYMPEREIVLCASIVKKDTFEWIVEKATELGVSRIIPVLSDRSEKKSLNEERLKKIAIEAAEQSGRGNVPAIEIIHNLSDLVDHIKEFEPNAHTLAFDINGELLKRCQAFEDVQAPLYLFIGPEGGWSEGDMEIFRRANVPIKSIGKQVLRAETAVVAVLSQFVFGIK